MSRMSQNKNDEHKQSPWTSWWTDEMSYQNKSPAIQQAKNDAEYRHYSKEIG